MFPGIPGFGIPTPEGEEPAVPVDEFVVLGGLGGGIKAAGLDILNLLNVESNHLRIYNRIRQVCVLFPWR